MAARGRAVAWIFVALALSILLLPGARAQDGGVLEGQVINGTAGAPPAGAGLDVTLHIFQGDAEVDTHQAVTQAGGGFRFEGLATGGDLAYQPQVTYQGVRYTVPQPLRFEQGQTELDTTITVYETTTDEAAIRLQSVHVIAESFGQVLRVSEVQVFGNVTDRTYVGSAEGAEQGTTVLVSLPEGAVGIALAQDMPPERFVEATGGLRDTEPVLPGDGGSQVFLSYHLIVPGPTVPVQRQFPYPVDDFNILVAQPGLDLQSEDLISRGPQSFQGRQFGFYTAQDLPAGQPVYIELLVDMTASTSLAMPGASSESLPPEGTAASEGSSRGSQGLLKSIGFALVLVVLLAAVAYPAATRPAARRKSPALTADPAVRRLLAELADLQAALEEGRIDEGSYEQRRAALYKALRSAGDERAVG